MESTTQVAYRISIISIIVNVGLSVLKLIAGIVAHSGAMISDAVHSVSDVFSTIVVMIGVKASSKQADACHPYGHERYECIAALFLASILGITGALIGYEGIHKLLSGAVIEVPGTLALIAAIVSIATKEWMYWFTRKGAKQINSGALMADAWHHRSDALSSIGSFIGIFGAMMGFTFLEPLASAGIAFFIIKAAYEIGKDAIDKMMDKSADQAVIDALWNVVDHHEEVLTIDEIKTRMFGSKIYVDIEISTYKESTLEKAHQLAHRIHDQIEREFEQVKHCMVHVNPK